MITKEVTRRWRVWAEQDLGGSAERIEAAMQAVVGAIDLGNKNSNEIVAAARSAALAWDAQHQQQQRAPQEYSGWRVWAEQDLGGSVERIEAAMQAVVGAIDLGNKNSNEIVAAARSAALAWDAQHQQKKRAPKGHPLLKFFLAIVALITIVMVISELLIKPPVVLSGTLPFGLTASHWGQGVIW